MRWVLGTLWLSSVAGLTYQVAVMDMLFTYFIRTSYTSSLVIGVFLFGLGAGSYLVTVVGNRLPSEKRLLMWIQFALSAYATLFFYNIYSLIPRLNTVSLAIISFGLLIIPTMILGATFALVGRIVDKNTGFIYALDLSGAVAGSFLTGFLFIPMLGVQTTVLTAALLSSLSGIAISSKTRDYIIGLLLSGTILALLLGVTTAPVEMESNISDSQTDDVVRHTSFGTIEIEQNWLFIDKIPQCSYNFTYQKGRSERELAELSLQDLKEKQVANIGLGCGSTLQKIQTISNASIDVVEINPAVIDLTRSRTEVLSNNQTQVIQDDGYLYMKNTDKTYDSIVIDVPNPAIAYSSNLYTKEMFEAVKSHLSTNGTLGLWVPPCHDEQDDERLLNILQNTLSTVFNYTYEKAPVLVASNQQLNNTASSFQASKDTAVNTVDQKVLNDFYTEQCTWQRRNLFQEDYAFIYE
jgi:spermidine synthase